MSLSNLSMSVLEGWTAAQWTSNNPVLASYEVGIESDTGKGKKGDNITPWASISSYFNPSGTVSGVGAWGTVTGTLSAQTDLQAALDLKAALISPTLVTPVIGVATGTSLAVTGLLKSSGTAGIGYATGAGGTIAQITTRTTGVTINKVCGTITLVSAAGSATPASFTVTNSAVGANDVIIVSQKSGTDLYEVFVTAVAVGSFQITSFTTGGTTTETPAFSFVVIKAVAA